MGIERLEAQIKELSRRVRKLEARSEKTAGRLPKSKRVERSSQRPSPQDLPREPELEGWPEIETIEFRSIAAFERDLARLTELERRRVVNAINSKCPLWLRDRRKAEKVFARPYRCTSSGWDRTAG
jgi:hypothetical protein